MLDLSRVKTYPIAQRKSLVSLGDFARPQDSRILWENKDFERLCRLVHQASGESRTLLLQMGAHVIKCGMSLPVCDLMQRRFVTHLAMNGACAMPNSGSAVIMPKVRENIEDQYFPPCKHVVRRPVSLGGEGFNFSVDHRLSMLTLHR